MKQTLILGFLLLMTIFTLSHPTPAFADNASQAHVDSLNDQGVAGWFYRSDAPSEQSRLTIRLTNAVTGAVVRELPVETSLERPDLEPVTGAGSTPGFSSPIDWQGLEGGLYSVSVLDGQTAVGNTLSYLVPGGEGGNGLPAGVTSVQNLGNFRITGYCNCRRCTAGWGGRTSSGTMATAGRTVAVDRRVIPMGSRLLINGTVYTAEDTGSGVKGNHIDIFCSTHSQARSLPFQYAQVFLLQ